MISVQPHILGQLLVEDGAIGVEELEAALRQQPGSGRRIGELLLESGHLDGDGLARALARQLGLRHVEGSLPACAGAEKVVRASLARERLVVPIEVSGRSVALAMADPLDAATVDDVRFQSGRHVEVVVASRDAVRAAIESAYGDALSTLVAALPERADEAEDPESLERAARAAPVVRLVDHILREAAVARASDVHVDANAAGIVVRYRVDGLLRPALSLPARAHRPLVSRLKVMAGMDIAVRRRPQDGGLSIEHHGRRLMLRVSTLPLTNGEKVVVRILDVERVPTELSALGVAPDELERLRRIFLGGQGVVLAAGPTGSGKSSTLHAALHGVDRERLNVVTLEDPIEYRVAGVTHVQVDPRAGLTFPAALRSVLRQDPDVIMVGEIRDRETAEIAMSAAVTGHLVLSTIHTMDAPGAITRLLEMGVPPYLVAGGLAGVVAQRLVRVLCTTCGGRSGEGCGRCDGGYRGRTGVFQILLLDDRTRDAIVRGGGELGGSVLRRLAAESGMRSMTADARRKVAEGITTPHEVGRVLRGDAAAEASCRVCDRPVPAGAHGCPHCGREQRRLCGCGREMQEGWRFCPWCFKPA